MSDYNFDYADKKFIIKFLNADDLKLMHWKEYGASEWYMFYENHPTSKSANYYQKRIIRKMVKLELLIPEIEDDKEYKVQRALGCVQGRVYYMPEKIREELQNDESIYL